MEIQFKEPWLLLLFLPVLALLVWSFGQSLRMRGARKAAAYLLRFIIFSLLIFSLAGLQWVTLIQRQGIVYVLDRSDSMADYRSYSSFITESAGYKKKEDALGIVTVGLDGAVERGVSETELPTLELSGQVNGAFTNVERGLQLAAGLFPEDVSPRIVLISDGQENVGDMLRQGRLLKDQGIAVDVLPLSSSIAKDVSIEAIRLPEKLYQAEHYTFELQLNSTFVGSGQLRLYEDNREISRQTVAVERGENRYVLQGLARDPGLHQYRAEIYFPEDEQAINNTAYAFSRVTGPPKVLIVEGVPNSSTNLVSALQSGLIQTEVVLPEMLSRELSAYQRYDSIVLNNVSATRMAEQQMEMIERAVKDYGVGLVMTGGEDSYGLGGYFKTPIERALPVKMELEGKRQLPSLGLILVIDRSGSMAGGKMELAKEAAMRTIELLRDQDTIGVVAFDSTPWWVVEPTTLHDRESVLQKVQSIQPAGGTDIYPAVQSAYQQMLKVDAQRKHLILLTDGQSATSMNYEPLVQSMVDEKMTLSTVAVGDGADTTLLESLARNGKGRYYFTNDQSTLPAIFSREAVMISRTYIVDQPFVPVPGQLGDWASWFAGGIPPIQAYVAVSPKPTSEVALLSPEPDPLLARWQYGSGRAVAWTSDIAGKWSRDWIAWSSFADVFTQLIKWTFPQFQSAAFTMDTKLEGESVALKLTSHDAQFQGTVKVEVTNDRLETMQLDTAPTAPGEFEAKMPLREPGVYLAKLDVFDAADSEKPIGSTTSGFVVPYSAEYRLATGDFTANLKQLAEHTGGRLLALERPEEVFASKALPKHRLHDLSEHLLIAALLLWVADIAVRRLSLPWVKLAAWPKSFIARMGQARAAGHEPSASSQLERLKDRQQRVGAFYNRNNQAKIKRTYSATKGAEALLRRGEEEINSNSSSKPVPPPAAKASPLPSAEESSDVSETMRRLLAAKKRGKK